MYYDRSNHYEFVAKSKELLPAGILDSNKEFEFNFTDIKKEHESYNSKLEKKKVL